MLKILKVLVLVIFLFNGILFAQPMVVAEPPAGKPEAKLVIRGTGFLPDEEIDIILKVSEEEKIGLGTTKVDIIKADSRGNWEAESAFPVFLRAGFYEIIILGSKGSQSKVKIEILPK